MPSHTSEKRVRLRPQDPFDLIRLLARSQSDPRKALAELVQNSLDAGARHIEILWFNDKGRRSVRVLDDGAGIFPELERAEALERIARTIGHSYKRDLSPAQRREEMVLGRYGIGLIGFWSVGREMLVKSRVDGGVAHVLRLVEDRPTAEVAPVRARRVEEEDTYTEITIHGVHASVVNKIRPPRLQAYLASELRGQLLERDATVTIRDRVARGRARKLFTVKARPYLGLPLADLRTLEVEGFEDVRVELYLVASNEDRRGVVTLSCGGTTVLDDLATIDGDDAPRSPWSSGRLEGVLDFPDFAVAPSTRRGLVHNEPLEAFLAVLPRLEARLEARLAAEAERVASEHRENLAKDIRRVFGPVARMLPEYELFDVEGRRSASGTEETEHDLPADDAARPEAKPSSDAPSSGAALARGEDDADETADVTSDPEREQPWGEEEAEEAAQLFPPGPLAMARIEPKHLRVPPLATRGLRARALDADGRRARGEVRWSWSLDGPGELESDGPTTRYTAPDASPDERVGATVRVEARQEDDGEVRIAQAAARVTLTSGTDGLAGTGGIPDPVPVHAPGESWRSRMRGNLWEFNEGHRDYRAACSSEARRLRYLVLLFAKELVLRNFGRPGDSDLLERLVELQACLDGGRKNP